MAIGTRMAPSYANLLMGKLKRKFLQAQDKIPQVWWRYTDDNFAIWDHGEPSLWVFLANLNHHRPTIKFTASCSADEVTFLDARVRLRDGLIGTALHVKPTNTHQYLQIDTFHVLTTHTIGKSRFLIIKLYAFDEFAQRRVISRSGPTNLKNIYYGGVLRAAIEYGNPSIACRLEKKMFATTTETRQDYLNMAVGHIPPKFTTL